jgi:hypothetical protein
MLFWKVPKAGMTAMKSFLAAQRDIFSEPEFSAKEMLHFAAKKLTLSVIPAQAGISHVGVALYVAERFLPAQE